MLVQVDYKRQLVGSTIAQMGFMLIQCALGAYLAAIIHAVLHGLFKSTLFLQAGSAIHHDEPISRNDPAIKVIFMDHYWGSIRSLSGNWFLASLSWRGLSFDKCHNLGVVCDISLDTIRGIWVTDVSGVWQDLLCLQEVQLCTASFIMAFIDFYMKRFRKEYNRLH